MRNVRQAVQRTRNAGVSTEIVREGELPETARTRLRTLAAEAMGGAEERGFSMNLDDLLTGRHETPVIVIARAGDGTPVGLQRYLPSARGRRLSLDAMRRAADSPNGLNERMIADVMEYAGEHGVREVSLNFAAFRELFDTPDRSPLEQGGYRLVHLLDPMIKVESLYLFNRKFRPRYVPRSVLFPSWLALAAVGTAMLTLEFGRRKPPGSNGAPVDARVREPEDAYPAPPPRAIG